MEDVPYAYLDERLTSRLARSADASSPVVLLFPNVLGLKTFDERRAAILRDALNVHVVVVDLYGEAALPRAIRDDREKSGPKAFPLMNAHLVDQPRLRGKISNALEAAKKVTGASKAAAVGFCFGGTCALLAVRWGLDVCGAVSLHGTIDPKPVAAAKDAPAAPVQVVPYNHTPGAKILVCTGLADPLVPRPVLDALEKELAAAPLADYSILSIGKAKHAFTDSPNVAPGPFGGYHEAAARQSWMASIDFLRDALGLPDGPVDSALWATLTKL